MGIGVVCRDQTPGQLAVGHRGVADRAPPFELVHIVHMDCWDCSRQADLSRSSLIRRGLGFDS